MNVESSNRMNNMMSFRRTSLCLLLMTACLCWTQNESHAQASWSLKDNNTFSPSSPKPLRPQLPAIGGSQKKAKPAQPVSRPRSRSRQSPRTQTGSDQGEKHVDLDTCIVSFIEDIELPAQESGVLRSLSVKEGQSFEKGQAIARIDDELYRKLLQQAQMQRDMALKRAADMTSIRAGRYKLKLASTEAAKSRKLLSKGSTSESEYKRARYSEQVAQEELVAAENEREMAGNEARFEEAKVEESRVRIRRHSIRTEFDGYVIKKFRDAGEWVQAGEKVLRVARMDRLYVQGNISSKKLNPFEVADKPVTVTLQLARGKETTFEGKIVSIGLEKQGSDLFMVKAEVENRPQEGFWTLLPGSQVKMRIHLDGKSAESTDTANVTLDSIGK
jgi:RND family efflux transporter MFP subunit